MSQPWDPEALWIKAKLFINRSGDAGDKGDFGEAALWASHALELLAKSALAKVNPLLVADPSDDGNSLLAAAGLPSDVSRYKSIPAKALFNRCGKAFKGFNAKEALAIASQRNAELHSGGLAYAGTDEESWWPRFWALVAALVVQCDASLADFVGEQRSALVELSLRRNAEQVAHRVSASIDRAAQRWTLSQSSQDARLELSLLTSRLLLRDVYEFHDGVVCPACGQHGYLLGDDILDSEVQYNHDDMTTWESLIVGVDAFECGNCALSLPSQEYTRAAGFPTAFQAEREYEPPWDDYGND